MSVLLESPPMAIAPEASTIACPCGSETLDVVGSCRDTAQRTISREERDQLGGIDSGTLYRCRSCSLGFRFPQPSPEALASLYGSMDSERWVDDVTQSHAWNRVWKLLADGRSSRGRILDVGAFTGGFLEQIPRSWDRAAIEPSSQARQILRKHGIDVVGELLASPSPELRAAFDIVTLFDVFEHLHAPIESMRWLQEMVRPGGRLILSTGNMDHWTWHMLRGEHWYLDPAQHLCFGSESFFRDWAQRNGLRVTHLETIPHGQRSAKQVLIQSLSTLYFAGRQRNTLGARVSRRLLHAIPPIGRLKHKAHPPYTRSLRDHLLIVFEVPA
ncbi:class I SAM-dependent methyltransferase [Roseiconus nitratireducens]|uniref:Class I SAM-dependent methyltransferase n=1 Tax=Roseiconus nitratireducens TaxID=2605748 RepID=A0A5M6D8Y1_9BACT|nr:class I SAM-dependent methyltransferase [Roseiconus nitratireducens]KAA5543813.1 class I SAM-dependent methyltransferase [Roseiconus nitratireducens]